MKSLLSLLFFAYIVLSIFFVYKGYEHQTSILNKYQCSRINQYTKFEKISGLKHFHKIGCSLGEKVN